MSPRFSVIITAYNAERYIERCLDSVVNQTFNNIQIIIINDGSTDSTAAIIAKYASKDARILFLDKTKNEGKPKGIIDGMLYVDGDYIAHVDSDDWIDYDYFEIINGYLVEEPEILINSYSTENGLQKNDYLKDKLLTGCDAVRSYPNIHTGYGLCFTWRMIMKRAFLSRYKIVPNATIKIGEDTEFNMRALQVAKSVLATSYGGYHYTTTNSGSITHQKYISSFEHDLNEQYNLRLNLCDSEEYRQNMAEYFLDLMLPRIISNAKNSPEGFKFSDMKRILHSQWVVDSFKFDLRKNSDFSFKQRVIRFFQRRKIAAVCFTYYRNR